ncbi:2866_t:CDS:2, partial [Gigaspora margarita]
MSCETVQYDSRESFNENEVEDILTDDKNIPTTAHNLLGLEFENYNENLPLIDTPFEIKVGTQFLSMLIAIHFVEQYAHQNRFAIYKHKKENFKDGTCRKRVFKRDLGGKYCEKLLTLELVTVSTFNNEHNHELSAGTLKFAVAYKMFSQEIMDQIEFYVVHSRCDTTTIRNLLQPNYSDRVFLTQDLGNAIQKIRREKGLDQSDAAALLSKLFELQAYDPAWFVKSLIDDTMQMSEISILDDNSFEPFFDKEVDDDSEIPVEANEDWELNLQSLITIVNPDDILKIWKVSRYGHSKCYQHIILLNNGEHLCTSCFHILMIPSHWFKDEYIDSNEFCSKETTINNCNFSHDSAQIQFFTQQYTVNNILSEKGYKKISQDRLKFGTLMGKAKKAIQFAVQDNDDELIQFIKAYNNKKEAQKTEAKKAKQQESLKERQMAMNKNQSLKSSKVIGNKTNSKGKNVDRGLATDEGHLEQPIKNLKEKYLKILKTQKTNAQGSNSASCIYEETTKRNQRTQELTKTNQDKKVLRKKDITIQLLRDDVTMLQLELEKIYKRIKDLEKKNELILQRWLKKINKEMLFYER